MYTSDGIACLVSIGPGCGNSTYTTLVCVAYCTYRSLLCGGQLPRHNPHSHRTLDWHAAHAQSAWQQETCNFHFSTTFLFATTASAVIPSFGSFCTCTEDTARSAVCTRHCRAPCESRSASASMNAASQRCSSHGAALLQAPAPVPIRRVHRRAQTVALSAVDSVKVGFVHLQPSRMYWALSSDARHPNAALQSCVSLAEPASRRATSMAECRGRLSSGGPGETALRDIRHSGFLSAPHRDMPALLTDTGIASATLPASSNRQLHREG